MPLEIHAYTLGPLDNNTYLLVDTGTQLAAIVDPAFDSLTLVETLRENHWQPAAIWITHAHFDHIAGVAELLCAWGNPLPIFLHPADLPLWQSGGGAGYFGFQIEPGPTPTEMLRDGQTVTLGDSQLLVMHVPGHSLGHVVYYSQPAQALLSGDVLFQGSIGRTDLPGGDFDGLVSGIKQKLFTLPDDTRVYPGHGPSSTIGMEKAHNPFLVD